MRVSRRETALASQSIFGCGMLWSELLARASSPDQLSLLPHAQVYDYRLRCYKGSHAAVTYGLGIPGLLLMAAGWPLVVACMSWVVCEPFRHRNTGRRMLGRRVGLGLSWTWYGGALGSARTTSFH